MPDTHTLDTHTIGTRTFVIERVILQGQTYYGCGWLPLRSTREALIQDIERAQGPEWRK